MSEENKNLLKSQDLKLHLKISTGDRISIGANGLDGYVNLRPGDYLEARLVDGSILVTQKPAVAPSEKWATADE